ncbi:MULTISPECIES: phosphate-starvation-inducible PsiE family protein [unclassified Lebetimonas]|uniref:phosphate-starvation-inducible PsiE family protein n=1 Tax=unclassified Lebetimonas TaxID=2648158 RepID=UPI0004659AC7|nr:MULTISPECIES: phosphate-starvation-inducible PsiE family protein [unclassified Lebetimonas]
MLNIEIIIASLLFLFILIFHYDFYHLVSLILEYIVIIEVVQMLFVFFKRQRIKLRYMIDAGIIFFIREVFILVVGHKNEKTIFSLVALIGIFFFFRYLSIKITYKAEKEELKND